MKLLIIVSSFNPSEKYAQVKLDRFISPTNTKFSSWWFVSTQSEKYYMIVKLDHFPRDRGENTKYLKPPASPDNEQQRLEMSWNVMDGLFGC